MAPCGSTKIRFSNPPDVNATWITSDLLNMTILRLQCPNHIHSVRKRLLNMLCTFILQCQSVQWSIVIQLQNFWMLNSRFKNTSGLQLEILNLRNRNRTLNQVCSKNNEERGDNCCMESLRVDFHEDYGWSFVISPKDFEANYCSGSYFGYLRTDVIW